MSADTEEVLRAALRERFNFVYVGSTHKDPTRMSGFADVGQLADFKDVVTRMGMTREVVERLSDQDVRAVTIGSSTRRWRIPVDELRRLVAQFDEEGMSGDGG